MSIQKFKILIFDSGVGGLSIYHALQNEFSGLAQKPLLPNRYIYFADHEAAPYGNKEDTWLNQRIHNLLKTLNSTYTPDMIIIACNTASTLSLDSLREHISTPIVGVVPAIKTAATVALEKQQKSIGLLATPATVQRSYIRELTEKFAQDLTLTSVGSTELVKLAEQKLNGETIDSSVLLNAIAPFVDKNCQQVALGCTHFPLLKQELESLAPSIEWIDSGQAIAKRAAHIKTTTTSDLAKSESMQCNNTITPSAHFMSSCHIEKGLRDYLVDAGFDSITTGHSFGSINAA